MGLSILHLLCLIVVPNKEGLSLVYFSQWLQIEIKSAGFKNNGFHVGKRGENYMLCDM